jgi:GH15 family glucan-1,4-alpha-glucosidase
MRTCALVGMHGSIDWLCIPRFDSPSIFGALLDSKNGGRFLICPSSDRFECSQAYEPLTNVLTTIFRGDNPASVATITDFMPCFMVGRTLVATGELHRRVQSRKGAMEFQVRMEPRAGYGSYVPDVVWDQDVGYTLSSTDDIENQGITLLTSQKFDEINKGTLTTEFKLNEGETLDFVLRQAAIRKEQGPRNLHTDLKLKETREYWQKWIGKCNFNGKWRDQVLRSALTLKLLFYVRTGASIAAATTSLPEEIGGSRNWDYRFSWIRDSSFVTWAFHSLGFNEEANSYLDWIIAAVCLTIDSLQPMIGITGNRELSERVIHTLSGYKGSAPVREGNGAWEQFQLDLYGIFVDALFFSHKHGRGVDRKVIDYLITPLINELEKSWRKPDRGIWEVRSEEEHFVYSKMWAWVGVDRAEKIAKAHNLLDLSEKWSKLRDEIREDIYKNGFDQTLNSFVRAYGTKELDAANLLMPQVRFIAGDDPKMIGTIDATMKWLLTDGKFVYRYFADDGMPGKEGAFLICSFWLVNCLTMCGRLEEAEKIMDSVCVYANHLGLYSEEVDPTTGDLLGNFPQAFTHMGFITAAVNLNDAMEKLEEEKRGNLKEKRS